MLSTAAERKKPPHQRNIMTIHGGSCSDCRYYDVRETNAACQYEAALLCCANLTLLNDMNYANERI